jgi:hypothetical protein
MRLLGPDQLMRPLYPYIQLSGTGSHKVLASQPGFLRVSLSRESG